jgi:hydroxypyruvate reductase
VIDRALAEAVLRDVIAACDPARRVREALAEPAIAARLTGRRRFAFAAGKAALAMARGAGEVVDGVAVVPRGAGGALPRGWRLVEAAHPEPDAASVAAGQAVRHLVAAAAADDVILALISGGASALIEVPSEASGEASGQSSEEASGQSSEVPSGESSAVPSEVSTTVPVGDLGELVATVRGVMAAGAPIEEINAVRGALSAIKAGKLARAAAAPIVTLAISDVIGDPLAVIGSGPTFGPWLGAPVATATRARAILARHGVGVPAVLVGAAGQADIDDAVPALGAARRLDHAAVIAPMASAAQAAVQALAARGVAAHRIEAPIAGEVEAVARALLASAGPLVAWGEPTLRVPRGHGVGGRAQQLALVLARGLRGTTRSALVVGTDGIDGPPPIGRPAPAGAWVDGTTWDAIAAHRDPAHALAICDAGAALAAVGALVVIGPSGINHADLVILG